MLRLLLTSSFSALLLASGCHTSKPAGTGPATTAAPVVVRFERTPCMGTCPAFVAEITADGTLRYSGHKFAPKQGDTTARVSAEVVRNIKAEAAAMRFHLMPADEYGHGMMDAPSAILTIDGHVVTCIGGECPPDLNHLHRYLDREIKTALGLEEEQ